MFVSLILSGLTELVESRDCKNGYIMSCIPFDPIKQEVTKTRDTAIEGAGVVLTGDPREG